MMTREQLQTLRTNLDSELGRQFGLHNVIPIIDSHVEALDKIDQYEAQRVQRIAWMREVAEQIQEMTRQLQELRQE